MRPANDAAGRAAAPAPVPAPMTLALRVLLDCVAVSLVVTLSVGLVTGEPFFPELAILVVEIWIYTILIAAPAHWLLPRLHAAIADRTPVAQVAALVAALLVICAAGSLAGSLVVFGLGLEPGATLWQLVSLSLRLSMALAVLACIVHAAVVFLRARLHATERQLHARELEYERALKLAAEARFAELESRVHPHFLFNTLNTVSSLIPTSPRLAERLIERLSALLRFSLDAHDEGLVTLEHELRIVVDYLEIERARFGERLRFAIDADAAVTQTPVPPFSVQTLVENAVKFAVAPSREPVEIRIRAARAGDAVEIAVADTGPGFEHGDLPAGHGLDNLRGRLTLLFGDANPLRIARRDGRTEVGFGVPA